MHVLLLLYLTSLCFKKNNLMSGRGGGGKFNLYHSMFKGDQEGIVFIPYFFFFFFFFWGGGGGGYLKYIYFCLMKWCLWCNLHLHILKVCFFFIVFLVVFFKLKKFFFGLFKVFVFFSFLFFIFFLVQ